jgi:putative Mg2+ transporter-C (MgtC) family protein
MGIYPFMLPPEVIILRLSLATALGVLIGFDRSRLEEAAGLRTHARVAMGACLLMIVSAFGFSDILSVHGVGLDPSRVAAQVVSGIGFLGAGTIIVQREIVKGLTTAASVWSVAAVGLAVGGGLYLAAISAAVLMLIILVLVRRVEALLHPHRRQPINLIVNRQLCSFASIRSAVEQTGVQLDRVVIRPQPSSDDEDQIQLWVDRGRSNDCVTVTDALRGILGVRCIETPLIPENAAESLPKTQEKAPQIKSQSSRNEENEHESGKS